MLQPSLVWSLSSSSHTQLGELEPSREFPKFLHKAFSQQQILYVPVGVVAHTDMAVPESWHSVMGTVV